MGVVALVVWFEIDGGPCRAAVFVLGHVPAWRVLDLGRPA